MADDSTPQEDPQYIIPVYHQERKHFKVVKKLASNVIEHLSEELSMNRNYNDSKIGPAIKNTCAIFCRNILTRVTRSAILGEEFNLRNEPKKTVCTEIDEDLKKVNQFKMELLLKKTNLLKQKRAALEHNLFQQLAKKVNEKVNVKVNDDIDIRVKGDRTHKERSMESALFRLLEYERKHIGYYEGLFEQMEKNFEVSKKKSSAWLQKIFREQQDKDKIIEFICCSDKGVGNSSPRSGQEVGAVKGTGEGRAGANRNFMIEE
jgi:hypothetical protein